MPNWCSNRVYVSGKPEFLQHFAATFGKEDEDGKEVPFSFNQTVPMGSEVWKGNWNEDLQCYTIPFNHDHGTDSLAWAREKWGTKWDACDVDIDVDLIRECIQKGIDSGSDEVIIDWSFNTAWCPPCEWLRVTSALFPRLEFKIACSEMGADFYGIITCKEGELSEAELNEGCTFTDEDDEDFEGEWGPTGEYAIFLDEHGIHSGG